MYTSSDHVLDGSLAYLGSIPLAHQSCQSPKSFLFFVVSGTNFLTFRNFSKASHNYMNFVIFQKFEFFFMSQYISLQKNNRTESCNSISHLLMGDSS